MAGSHCVFLLDYCFSFIIISPMPEHILQNYHNVPLVLKVVLSQLDHVPTHKPSHLNTATLFPHQQSIPPLTPKPTLCFG